MSAKLYDTDFYSWALSEAEKLRRRSHNELDWDNLAEEIEALSRTEARELRSRYVTLLLHLLKWMYQPERRRRSWRNTIERERREVLRHLGENPALKAHRDEIFGEAFGTARLDASSETDLDVATFPETNPFTIAQAMDEDFWPDAPANQP
jgi:hypothetical protein